jgi:3-deoxy-D-manno-octulosonate 8-phosphate phosphatase (KDO 8-P phosphatase)
VSAPGGPGPDDALLAPFRAGGALLLAEPSEIRARFSGVRALLFDWDGVFNAGAKGDGPSGFSEADAMGTNLLRFGLWTRDDGRLPFVGILTGQDNPAAVELARRERFQAVYRGFLDKGAALEDLSRRHGIRPDEICFLFDDVLDLGVAGRCGLRILVRNGAAPLLGRYVGAERLAEYVTGREGGAHAVRESAELLLGLAGLYDGLVRERAVHGDAYRRYLALRNAGEPEVREPADL